MGTTLPVIVDILEGAWQNGGQLKRERRTADEAMQVMCGPGGLFPCMTVGVMDQRRQADSDVRRRVRRLGVGIAKRGYVLITGPVPACLMKLSREPKKAGGIVVGVSPALNFEEHVKKYVRRHVGMMPSSILAAPHGPRD